MQKNLHFCCHTRLVFSSHDFLFINSQSRGLFWTLQVVWYSSLCWLSYNDSDTDCAKKQNTTKNYNEEPHKFACNCIFIGLFDACLTRGCCKNVLVSKLLL